MERARLQLLELQRTPRKGPGPRPCLSAGFHRVLSLTGWAQGRCCTHTQPVPQKAPRTRDVLQRDTLTQRCASAPSPTLCGFLGAHRVPSHWRGGIFRAGCPPCSVSVPQLPGCHCLRFPAPSRQCPNTKPGPPGVQQFTCILLNKFSVVVGDSGADSLTRKRSRAGQGGITRQQPGSLPDAMPKDSIQSSLFSSSGSHWHAHFTDETLKAKAER